MGESISAHNSKVAVMARKSRQLGLEAAGDIISTIKKKKSNGCILLLSSLSPFRESQIPFREQSYHSGWAFLTIN